MAITQTMVEGAFIRLQSRLPKHKLSLAAYRPDRTTLYRVEEEGFTPFGSNYWLGSLEAFEGIHLIIKTLEFVERDHAAN